MKRTFDKTETCQLWINKYQPLVLKDFLGNSPAIKQLQQWLAPKSTLRKKHAFILLNGPPGVGKTLAARLVAESLGYRVLSSSVALISIPDGLLQDSCTDKVRKQYLNSMSDESKQLYSILMSVQHQNQLFKQSLPPALILDDFDGLTMKMKSLLDCIKLLSCPTILICNDRYENKLKSIGTQVLHVAFTPVPNVQIEQLLKKVCQAERIPITPSLSAIAQQSKGDVRYALMTLQFLHLPSGLETGKKPALLQTTPMVSFKDAIKQSFSTPTPLIQMNDKSREGSNFNDVIRLFQANHSVAELFKIIEGDDGLDHSDLIFTWRIHDTYLKTNQESMDITSQAAEAFSLADTDYPGSLLAQVESNIKVPWLTAGSLTQSFIPPFPPLVQTLKSTTANKTHWNEVFTHLTTPNVLKELLTTKKTRKNIEKPEKHRILLASSLTEFLMDNGAQALSPLSKGNKRLTTEDRKTIQHHLAWSKDLTPGFYPIYPVNPEDLV